MPIHPTAIIDSQSTIDPTATIGPYTVVEAHVTIGPRTVIGPHCHIIGWTTIGADNTIGASAVIGADPQDLAYDGSQTWLEIGNNNIIREHVSIHRGTAEGSKTVIGDGNFLMGGSHVGHNCTLGNNIKMVNGALLAGHVQVESDAFLGGSIGIHQFARIGRLAMVAGMTRVVQDVPPFMTVMGSSRIVGINRIGMRRAGFSAEQISEVNRAFRTLCRSDHIRSRAIEIIIESMTTDPGRHIAAFLAAPSKRGICSGRRDRADSDLVE